MNARIDFAADADIDLSDRGVLRFITAGSVDDGKSTLIGRLLFDTRSVLSDQLAALARAGRRAVATSASDAEVDLSLLTDGLEAEREQGITIDVAYRYFATARRKFIIADTPGHEQYTRNMVTGASTADAAVILIDATRVQIAANGTIELLPQTRRHSALVHLLGLQHIVIAVNKMDRVEDPRRRFDAIVAAYRKLAASLGIAAFDAIPVSALHGDNVVRCSSTLAWYRGPTLLEWLEGLDTVGDESTSDPLRFAVQYVDKAETDEEESGARRYLGRIGSGELRVGQALQVLPAGTTARVAAIETFDRTLPNASVGQSVALRLDRELDVSRGDWLVDPSRPPLLSRALRADLAWLDSEPLAPQRKLVLRHGTRFVLARVRRIEAVLDLAAATWSPSATSALAANDIARVVIETQQTLPVDPYERVRASGSAVLVDPATNHTVGAVMLRGIES
jgi:sulfate adenylyltransferase subunit 1